MKQLKRGLAFFLAAVLMMSSMSVGVQAASTKKATVKSVSITKPDTKTLVLKKGKTYKIKTKVTTTGKASKKLQYTSSNKKVAKIDSKGKIKALKKGKTTITVKSVANKKKKATLKVIVGTPVTKVALDKKTLSLTEGEKAALKATVSPKKPSVKKVSFTSSNKQVATVDSKGNVTAVKAGSAKITAKATDGSGKKAVCQVTVVKKQDPVKPQDPVKTEVEVTGVTATISPATIKLGGKAQITAAVVPSNATDKSLTYTSSDVDVATVNKKGKVTATGYGTATITVASTNGKTAEVTITVEKSAVPSSTTSENGIKQYEGYTLQWSDEFDGDSLDTENWNVETHEAGWVNAELQEYVNSEDNIKVVSGNLIISPVQTAATGSTVAEGHGTYTSGRINTAGKQDYKYGLFEARVKVPEGKGYLPAFWMMPDENVYGQWPVCGEIDIMEVMGHATDTAYGTIHYGNPHKENQGTYKLNGSFADDYHTFALEWLPGELIWYVDGEEFYRTSDWYSAKAGQGTLTYPAPFDQEFHVILNLAVGGSWVGYPDDEDFEANDYCVDYVRIYQKTDGYDESNVQAPEKDELDDPTIGENLIRNGDFAVVEDLEKDVDWKFATAQDGVGQATISNKAIHIATTNAGQVDYSIQLYQSNIPMKKGATYEVSYDAYADAPRKMMSKVSAPENGWAVYGGGDPIDLTTQKKTYTYTAAASADDPYGRLEFNMGAFGSTAAVHISNVSVKAISYTPASENDAPKTVLADGNYVYNGEFNQGAKYLGDWEITNPAGATISVTGKPGDRKLKVEAPAGTSAEKPVVIAQSGLALTDGKYAFSYGVQGPESTTLKVSVAGEGKDVTLTGSEQEISEKLALENITNKDLVFTITAAGTYYLSNVRIVEDKLIKNGSFNTGKFSGYEPFADGSATASWVVDSQSEDNAADFSIEDTGKQDWMIQLKQNNVPLENGKYYRLSFKVKSSIDRDIMYAIQRDGSKHDDDWTPYVQKTISLTASKDYTDVVAYFEMQEESDPEAVLSISMGAVGGKQITDKHRICLDDFVLEEIDESEMPKEPEVEAKEYDTNLFNDPSMEESNTWILQGQSLEGNSAEIKNGTASFTIATLGENPWDVELKQENLTLEKGEYYVLSFNIQSSTTRKVKVKFQQNGEEGWEEYFTDEINLQPGKNEYTSEEFKMKHKSDDKVLFAIDMGNLEETLDSHTVAIFDLSYMKVHHTGGAEPENMLSGGVKSTLTSWQNKGPEEFSVTLGDESAVTDIWDDKFQLIAENINIEKGKTYKISFRITSDDVRQVKTGLQINSGDYHSYGSSEAIDLEAETEKLIEYSFTMEEETDAEAAFVIQLAKPGGSSSNKTVTIKDLSLVEVTEVEE